jgi:hypothetical protein
MLMIGRDLQSDVQWVRALGAVAAGFWLFCGVMQAGGPAALAREARPATRLATTIACMTVSALNGVHAADLPRPGAGR